MIEMPCPNTHALPISVHCIISTKHDTMFVKLSRCHHAFCDVSEILNICKLKNFGSEGSDVTFVF